MKKRKKKQGAARNTRKPAVKIDPWYQGIAKSAVVTDPKLFGIAIINPPEAHKPDGEKQQTS